MMTPTTPGAAAATILFAFTTAADCPPSRAPPSLGKPSNPLPRRRLGLEPVGFCSPKETTMSRPIRF